MNKDRILAELRQYNENELYYKMLFANGNDFHPTINFYREYNLKKIIDFSGITEKELFSVGENNNEARPITYDNEGPSIYLKKHLRYIPHLEHTHTFFEIICPLEGSCICVIDGQKIRLHEGQISIISPFVSHHIEDADESIIIKIYIETRTFYGALIHSLQDDSALSSFFLQNIIKNHPIPNLCFDFSSNRELKESMDLIIFNLLEEQQCPDQHSSHVISSLLVLYFAYLSRYCPEPMKTASPPQILAAEHRKIILDIIQNCHCISLRQLSERYHYTPTYISKLIRRITGDSYSHLVQNCKIQRAKTMLSSTAMPVEIISGTLGYANTESFVRNFRKHTGMTPTNYRKAKKLPGA